MVDLYSYIVIGLLTVLTFTEKISGQQNPIFNQGTINNINHDPQNQQASSNKYYFDRNSDCNKATRNIYDTQATIYGHGSGTAQQGPESCEIKIKSDQQFAGTTLVIEVRSMTINDCGTTVAIYDGETKAQLLYQYDCKTVLQLNTRTKQTSGSSATFIMTRRDTNQFNYNVQIIIKPIRAGVQPGGNTNHIGYIFDKFEQKSIVGMVGGFYVVILIVCTFCIGQRWRTFNGLTKEWETRQLATIKTNDDFQRRQLMNERAKERSGPPTYTSRNDSYLEPEDAEDSFTEKVITPRVHTRRNRRRNSRRPLSNHSESEEASEEESESDESTRKRHLSSDESDQTRSTSESETEEDSESEDESDNSSSRHGRQARSTRWKPRKESHKNSKKVSSRDSHDSRDSRDTRDSRNTAASRRRQPPPHVAYPAYPPGQFVPVMAAPPGLQPVQMVPAYPPQPYPDTRGPPTGPPTGPPVQPTDPPVYSYLVRRGYTPLDAQSEGSGLSQRSGAGRLEEPETRLSSGVEYMRR